MVLDTFAPTVLAITLRVYLLSISVLCAFDSNLGWQPKPNHICGGEFTPLPELDFNPKLKVQADNLTTINKNLSELSGNVKIAYKDMQVLADTGKVSYDVQSKDLKSLALLGNIQLFSQMVFVYANQFLYFHPNAAKLGPFSYRVLVNPKKQIYFYGKGDSLVQNQETVTATNVTASSCSMRNPTWRIKINKANANVKNKALVAKGNIFYWYNVPVFYFPVLYVPLTNERLSGFLMPKLGYSSTYGPNFSLPYYFNLASNIDLKVKPTFGSKQSSLLVNLRVLYQGLYNSINFQSDVFSEKPRWGVDYLLEKKMPSWSLQGKIQLAKDQYYFIEKTSDFTEPFSHTNKSWLEYQHQYKDYDLHILATAHQGFTNKPQKYHVLPSINVKHDIKIKSNVVIRHSHHFNHYVKGKSSASFNYKLLGCLTAHTNIASIPVNLSVGTNIAASYTKELATNPNIFAKISSSPWFYLSKYEQCNIKISLIFTSDNSKSTKSCDFSTTGLSVFNIFNQSKNQLGSMDHYGGHTINYGFVYKHTKIPYAANLSISAAQFYDISKQSFSPLALKLSICNKNLQAYVKSSIAKNKMLQSTIHLSLQNKHLNGAVFFNQALLHDQYIQSIGINTAIRTSLNTKLICAANLNLNNNKTLFGYIGYSYSSCCWDIKIVYGKIVLDDVKSNYKLQLDFAFKGLGTNKQNQHEYIT